MNTPCPLPAGYQAAGIHCGIKPDTGKLDLSLFVSDVPASVAGVFTQNRVCGAPVRVSRERLPRGTGRALVINSGNANACTGDRGIEDARWMTSRVAGHLGCEAEDVAVCSTGIIGHFLPRGVLDSGFPRLVDQLSAAPEGFLNAARGMLTTDTFSKQATRTIDVNGRTVRVSAAAKGAAMIAPNMATMLSVILTDAELTPAEADRMLRHAVRDSFNCISVEGHTSTSDSVLLFANGAAGAGPLTSAAQVALQTAIDEVAIEMAQAIIRDAEGADHFVTVEVAGARTRDEAVVIARAIANGPLVKTAVTGNDPNWGRIISAAGYCGVDLQEEDMSLQINGVEIYRNGAPADFDEAAVSASMRESRDVSIRLELTLGEAAVRFWTCDLTAEYVRLNSEYST